MPKCSVISALLMFGLYKLLGIIIPGHSASSTLKEKALLELGGSIIIIE